jgi:hypothetical protein
LISVEFITFSAAAKARLLSELIEVCREKKLVVCHLMNANMVVETPSPGLVFPQITIPIMTMGENVVINNGGSPVNLEDGVETEKQIIE